MLLITASIPDPGDDAAGTVKSFQKSGAVYMLIRNRSKIAVSDDVIFRIHHRHILERALHIIGPLEVDPVSQIKGILAVTRPGIIPI